MNGRTGDLASFCDKLQTTKHAAEVPAHISAGSRTETSPRPAGEAATRYHTASTTASKAVPMDPEFRRLFCELHLAHFVASAETWFTVTDPHVFFFFSISRRRACARTVGPSTFASQFFGSVVEGASGVREIGPRVYWKPKLAAAAKQRTNLSAQSSQFSLLSGSTTWPPPIPPLPPSIPASPFDLSRSRSPYLVYLFILFDSAGQPSPSRRSYVSAELCLCSRRV